MPLEMSGDLMSIRGKLSELLRSSIDRSLPEGWLFLQDKEVSASTECVFLTGEDYSDDEDVEIKAAQLGFPVEGLDTQTLEDVCAGALALDPYASDALLVRAFDYYRRFDAFLPGSDAGDPPSPEEVLLRLDRQFYDSLGAEVNGTACRREGCERGAVRLSVFCRKHHCESIRKRPCPFE